MKRIKTIILSMFDLSKRQGKQVKKQAIRRQKNEQK